MHHFALPCPKPARQPLTRYAIAMTALAFIGGCVNRPVSPILQPAGGTIASATATAARVDALLPADALLIGEQHDAAEHQQIEQQVVAHLAGRGLLAALAIEMADAGASTAKLKPTATEQQTQNALKWNEKGWPWAAYGPAVMTAVRAGVPVLGANLPGSEMRGSMGDVKLDTQLPGPALKAQQQLIRIGHCNLLPESQITPMTRVQIARDRAMAQTIEDVALPGKVVVLLAGNGHVNRQLGVPQHLPATLHAKAVHLRAGDATDKDSAFDSTWPTPALAEKDYCAGLREQFGNEAGAEAER
jgi:uncharacterized iron-regulated protein